MGKHLGKTLISVAHRSQGCSLNSGLSFPLWPTEIDIDVYVNYTVILRQQIVVRSKTICEEFGL
jgi:hypothetical protein